MPTRYYAKGGQSEFESDGNVHRRARTVETVHALRSAPRGIGGISVYCCRVSTGTGRVEGVSPARRRAGVYPRTRRVAEGSHAPEGIVWWFRADEVQTRRMGSFMRDEENPTHVRRSAAGSKVPRVKRCVIRRRGEVKTECESETGRRPRGDGCGMQRREGRDERTASSDAGAAGAAGSAWVDRRHLRSAVCCIKSERMGDLHTHDPIQRLNIEHVRAKCMSAHECSGFNASYSTQFLAVPARILQIFG
ncbi:hypothetical protein DFH08DRAFT_1017790 [Mycena albidolilacea]|uniref:Uncharacterized protein n=1 Tax=Mycena albidolilacea TaxID=1033008 RepID=A0AAD6ZTC0_9AGAR|nr:hypothetical protein DFH08DRAFT_1017790 [Mycena albidolilacea]